MDEIHKENPNEASEKALRRWQKDKMNVAEIQRRSLSKLADDLQSLEIKRDFSIKINGT